MCQVETSLPSNLLSAAPVESNETPSLLFCADATGLCHLNVNICCFGALADAVVFLVGQSLSLFFSLRWQLFPVNKRNPAVCLTVEQLYSYSAGSSDQNKSLMMTKY